ncbi:unnamed protein product [Adineta ricciae]|uniref:G-protein coupled receptors family 1 profile domain-containing protein n=1 Tax=Adineta ricciae TaxID=249248 RepID=A0A815ANS6_ADIRI|nr:unnamed protein product [Adineta ricciae]CAF1260483.1 unnamed protein product [Adineta ricciae]
MSSSAILTFASNYSLYCDLITFVLGFIGNILNLLVFVQLKCFRDHRITYYFIIDIIAIFINRTVQLFFTISTSFYQNDLYNNSLIGCRARTVLVQAAGNISYTMVYLAAIDQYCSTNYRPCLRQLFTFRFVQRVIIVTVCFWFSINLLFALYLDVHPLYGCNIYNDIWSQYVIYFHYPVLIGIFPITMASIFSLLAYQNVRRIIRRQIPIERRRFDQQITAMVLIRVIFFLLLFTPWVCYRIYSINATTNNFSALQFSISRLVQVITICFVNVQHGIGFYLYIMISSRYRRQVKYVLRKRIWQLCRCTCHKAPNRIFPDNLSTGSNFELQ